ncbi:MAG: M23 family peptidase, partial [Alphaproteobacteria bacterium]|nr:M23 family peptidase [Alphaproteobacteria bacterium]
MRLAHVLVGTFLALATPAIGQTSIQLELPLACVPGDNCWVVNYVDHDPGSGRRDYYCRHMT